jgi:hypothetical protein
MRLSDIIQGFSAGITALATAAIAYFTWSLRNTTNKLWQASDRQLAHLQREFAATHRPKLRVRGIRIRVPERGGPGKIQYTVVNTGDTAACLTLQEVTLLHKDADHEPMKLPCFPLNGGASMPVEIEIVNRYDSAFDLHGGTLTIRGRLEYKDGSDITRRTGFIATYDPASDWFRRSDNSEEEYAD